MQQIFGGLGRIVSWQHNEVYDIYAVYAEMFSFFVIFHGHMTAMSHKGFKCCPQQLISNQWAFTMLETEVFEQNF